MLDRQKIITMTKLALYDKHEGASDRAANDYFRHDYIYKKNIGTRISVGIGGAVILALYWLRVFFVDGTDIFEIQITCHITEAVLFIVAIVAAYSVIGMIQGTREYYLVQKRLQQYQAMIRFLENAEERSKKTVSTEEEPEEKSSASSSKTRSQELREQREQRIAARALREESRLEEKTDGKDPLANVSARAIAGSRPRISSSALNARRERSRLRYITDEKDEKKPKD